MIKIVSNRGVIEIVALFAVVLLFGFAIANAALATSKVTVINSSLASPQFTYFAYFLDGVIFFILLLMILRRHHSKTALFRALEFVITGFTSFFVFLVVYAIFIPQNIAYVAALPGHIEFTFALPLVFNLRSDYVLAIASALVLLIAKEFNPVFKDIATMVSSIGVGVLLGISFPFGIAMIILAVVALYDYISIFLMKAMVKIDKALIAMNISFLISVSDIQAVPRGRFSEKEEDEYEEFLIKSHEAEDPKFKRIIKAGKLPVLSQISLGEGDLSLPLMMAVSAYYTFLSYSFTILIMMGAMIGVLLTMYFLKRYKKPLPAIPLFFASIGIASGLAYEYIGIAPGLETAVMIAMGIGILGFTVNSLRSSGAAKPVYKTNQKRMGAVKKGR